MNTDDTRYSVPAVWSRLYNELKGSPWEDEDAEAAPRSAGMDPDIPLPAAYALKEVYNLAESWPGADPEDAVLAVLKAAHKHYGTMFLTPGQVKEMAGKFSVFYEDMDEPLEEYLLDHYNGIELEWLNDQGLREIRAQALRDSEIWIYDELNLPGVWVFSVKPGA